MTQLNLILARARNGVIGLNNALPWHLPEDMAHFKRVTSGHTVIMGRKTWDSLPNRFRPLPGRTNVVVTRQTDWQAEGAVAVHSLKEATEQALQHSTSKQVWVIGGAAIYAAALPHAHTAIVTEIDSDFEGDAFAPQFGPDWLESHRSSPLSGNGLVFSFVTYIRHNPGF